MPFLCFMRRILDHGCHYRSYKPNTIRKSSLSMMKLHKTHRKMEPKRQCSYPPYGYVVPSTYEKLKPFCCQKPLPHGTFSTVVLSLPTSSVALRGVTLFINTLLLLCVSDLLTQPIREPASSLIFTRVGAVDPDGAKIVIRWPEVEGGAIRIVWRQVPAGVSDLDKTWKNGPIVPLRNETDWVGVGRIAGLWPSTGYECASISFFRISSMI